MEYAGRWDRSSGREYVGLSYIVKTYFIYNCEDKLNAKEQFNAK